MRELLAANYVCVYLDTSRAGARRLADALEVTRGRGLVISDRTGEIQAFHHDGDLSDVDLVRNLERFANADGPVRMTQSIGRVSYYPPQEVAPARSPPVFYGGGGRSC